MPFKDILVALTSYPDPAPVSAAEDAVAVAAALGAHLTAISCETYVEVPGRFISTPVVSEVLATEAAKSRKNALELLAAFEAAAARAGIPNETIFEKCLTLEIPDLLVEYARLRDLTIMPASSDQWYAETVIFGSGRPTLILPVSLKRRPFRIGTVAVAWDFSRAAARAISDAMPILELAKQVRIVTVVNEKPLDTRRSGAELARNFSRHGLDVVLDQVDAKGCAIGEVLENYTSSQGADLLVMGAYGHSKWREFVLGGATRSLLAKPPLPILLSH
ncbi:universal stress protein [Bradyrhizobium sp.]|uniref:universal stress protein n=1 Tax=Bradyrhizobium sp. TaxID=376 RepID=UPI002736F054|nr:universal stress protein [Bradyrhizobium sp.]MDP3689645.1 universal stress protein [Bradyrhizobium sp.]